MGLYQSLYDWLVGKRSKAHKTWHKSLAAAQGYGTPYMEGRLHYEIGRHLAATDPARDEHLSQARDIFERLGAAYDLIQVETLS